MVRTVKKTLSVPEDLDARVRGWAEEHSVSYSEAVASFLAASGYGDDDDSETV